MHTHPNARLTPLSRERLLRRHIDCGESLKALAAQAGISLRTAYKWLARFRSGGHISLADRRSVRRTQRWTLDPQQLQHALDLAISPEPSDWGYHHPRPVAFAAGLSGYRVR